MSELIKPTPFPLSNFLSQFNLSASQYNIQELIINDVTNNSRKVLPGSAFVAWKGVNLDGHQFFPEAIHNGAVVVFGTEPMADLPIPYIQVPDSRVILAHLAAALYGYPARNMVIIGVTGTDGKTTTSNLIYHILRCAGLKVGMISTVNAIIGDQIIDTGFHVTTPDAPDVARYLAMMNAQGITHVILEATSHGLAQKRVEACEFDIGVVTNITHEHLDFHGSYEAYRDAKAHLFTLAATTKPKPFSIERKAILNCDDSSFDYLKRFVKLPYIGYGKSPCSNVRLTKVISTPNGLQCEIKSKDYILSLSSPLLGEYNGYNIAAAAAVGKEIFNLPDDVIQAGISSLEYIPGRMERIDYGQPFTAIVDFAHTPNALKNALLAARSFTKGRIIAIFGSAGLRDKEKRRLMAEISAQHADITILTAEDPRTESLDDILAEMADGAISRGGIENKTFWRIPDRCQAIRFGVQMAQRGDTVMACGKGHEQSMCFGTTEYLWDDRIAMRAAIGELLGIPTEPMPFLPT